MTMKPMQFAFVLALAVAAATVARGQESGKKAKDAELESLLENLKDREEGTVSASKKAAKPEAPPQVKSRTGQPATTKKSANPAGPKQGAAKSGEGAGGQAKPAPKPPGTGGLAPKDQAIDDLLGKLGETKDEPAREERPRNQGPGAGQPPAERKAGEKDRAKLGGKDKEIDDRLEEIAGRRRKKPRADDEERSGPIGEMIKEMRDVEKRLGKPDPSEDTQAKQKQIVKHIDKLIEQVRQSGSSAGRLTMRRRQQPGNQPGQQDGDQTGALARGAGPMKATKPTSQHSTAGGKGIWGHLPEELRQVMNNSFKEVELGSKAEMISRYFTSVAKGKPIREE
jgi:hypothetical protein